MTLTNYLYMKKSHFVGILTLVIIVVIGYRTYQAIEGADQRYNTEVHVHADFAVHMNGNKLDFSQTKYQSSVGHEKDQHVHLHDGDGKVVHRHAEGVTFAQFLTSLGYKLTNDCFASDTGEEFCSNASSSLTLIVNEKIIDDKTVYVPQEEDKILLTYGAKDADVKSELASITDESCIHTGTCPERGVPEVESCGLTCDVTLSQSKITLKEIANYVFLGHY